MDKKEKTKFEKEVYKTNEVNLNLIEYLEESLKSDKKSLCNGWDYLRANLTKELKKILTSFNYWKKTYNSEKAKVILFDYKLIYGENYILNDELKNQLESFVYVWNDKKQKIEEKEKEENLKEELLKRGFKEVEFLKYIKGESKEKYNKRKEELYKPLNNLKVVCVFDKDKVGILGGFTEKCEFEGKLVYLEDKKLIAFLPKRHTKTGQILTSKFYYKLKGGEDGKDMDKNTNKQKHKV